MAKKNQSAVSSDVPVHTLPSLMKALGAATLDEVMVFVSGYPKPVLVREGAAVATPRITLDAARIYGQAFDFLNRATPEQLDSLPGFTQELLRIAVWAAGEGDGRYNAFAGQKQGEVQQQSSAGAGATSLKDRAEARRDQLHACLAHLAGGSPDLLAAAATAYGSAEDPAGAIDTQAKLARAWLKSPPAGVAPRLKMSRVDEAWLKASEALAQQYRDAAKAAAATRSARTLAPADVDLMDGINLALLRTVAAQFEAGHAGDPTIPRLNFNALLSHVHRSHHTPSTPPNAPAPGSSTPATT